MNEGDSEEITSVFNFLSVEDEKEEEEVVEVKSDRELEAFSPHLELNNEDSKTEEDGEELECELLNDVRVAMIGNVDSGKVF